MKHYWYRPDHDCEASNCPDREDWEIIEMQTIDADCNDCKHFKRGKYHGGQVLKWFEGHCLKFDKPTRAYPVQWTGHECFEHRKMA